MKPTICILVILCPILSIAQPKPLLPGDSLPSIQISGLVNHPFEKMDFSTGKDSILLLNFMSVSCISCLHALPKIQNMQQRFGIAVILVTADKKQKWLSFLQKNTLGQNLSLPIVAEDTLLKSYFPHQFISHIVWIKNNKVRAITRSEYITEENIKTLINDLPFSLPLKLDRIDYDYSKTLLVAGQDTQLFHSVLLPHLPGVPHRFTRGTDTAKGLRWFRFINYSITGMLSKTVGLPLNLSRDQLDLRVSDTSRFIIDKLKQDRQLWNAANTFCYEASFPAGYTEQECLLQIRTDLDARFNLRTRLLQKDKPVLQIEQTNKSGEKPAIH